MLTHLHIKNFTIIDTAEVELQSGMIALTGETGAGKSILLDAIGLVLGDRGDTNTVRQDTERADITATFQPDSKSPVWQWLRDNDLNDGDQCMLRRVVPHEGKSRGYINGHPVSMQTLRTVGEMLVDIHGQHEHYTLTQRQTQRQLLDSTLPRKTLLQQVSDAYQRWNDIQQKILDLSNNTEQRAQRIDMLSFQLQEFDSLSIGTDELATIESEYSRLSNAGRLLELANAALAALDDNDQSVGSQLNAALKNLDQLSELDDSLSDCVEVLNTASILTTEASTSVREYASRLDLDGNRLTWLDERLSQLHRLAKKHHTDIPGLALIESQLRSDLDEIDNSGDAVDSLVKERDALREMLDTQSVKLGNLRKKAASKLNKSVSEAMHALGMEGGQFLCEVSSDKSKPSRSGYDDIRFLVSPNPGMKAGDISKIASGGELSRISLALSLVTTSHEKIPTLIFDEVDSGIGGAVAMTVGSYLRKLGSQAQVLCVTHLPQVAAHAHHHLQVSKQVSKGKTRTSLTELDTSETVDEIARMLGGAALTRKSRQHAKEMLESVD